MSLVSAFTVSFAFGVAFGSLCGVIAAKAESRFDLPRGSMLMPAITVSFIGSMAFSVLTLFFVGSSP